MTYRIRYSYSTGNSFGVHDEESVLELTWENKNAARRALADIKEHYEYYRALHQTYPRLTKKEREVIEIAARSKSWFIDGYLSEYSLIIKSDSGRDFQFSAPWCGFFERLYECQIIDDDPRDSFSMRR